MLCGSQIHVSFFPVKIVSGKLRVLVFFHRKFIIIKVFRNCWIYYWNLIMEIIFQIWNKNLNCRTNKTATRILTCVNMWSFNEHVLLFYSIYYKLILWYNNSSKVGTSCVNIIVRELLQTKSRNCLVRCEERYLHVQELWKGLKLGLSVFIENKPCDSSEKIFAVKLRFFQNFYMVSTTKQF